MARPDWELACFDLDGTLVRRTSIGRFLGDELGQRQQHIALERAYANGEIANADVAVGTAEAFTGRTLDWVAGVLDRLPCIDGIDATLAALRARGIESLICHYHVAIRGRGPARPLWLRGRVRDRDAA